MPSVNAIGVPPLKSNPAFAPKYQIFPSFCADANNVEHINIEITNPNFFIW
jgi:hypothetical protein